MKIKQITLPLLAFLLLVSCSSKEKEISERVQRIAKTAELGTVEYKIKKVVKVNDDKTWWKIGDRRALFVSTAYLKAGIDLDGFSADRVQVNGKNVILTLPAAKLLSFNMPAEETTLEHEDYGMFRSRYNAEEQNEILQQGETAIRDDVPNLGILQDAEENARDIFTALLTQMGYKNITINFDTIEL